MTPTVAVPKPRKVKPKLRGTSHVFAFVAAVGGLWFLWLAPVTGPRWWAGLAYGASLVLLFGFSALYHRPMWGTAARARLRRIDHSNISLLVAGTYTPLAVLESGGTWTWGLSLMWGGAAVIIAVALFYSYGPRQLRAGLYVAQGFIAVPVMWHLHALVGPVRVWLMLAGALVYIGGAVVYALRWPNPRPKVFGYHEVFHAMVVAAASLHYGVVLDLQSQL